MDTYLLYGILFLALIIALVNTVGPMLVGGIWAGIYLVAVIKSSVAPAPVQHKPAHTETRIVIIKQGQE